MVYRPGVMSEEEATQHMHGFATRFYASHLARVAKEGSLAGKEIEEEISDFDEMYYLLELASLATMVAVEAYDWDNFPSWRGCSGPPPRTRRFSTERTRKSTLARRS
jgi:hypothetical protein